jgi:hypothetical protein
VPWGVGPCAGNSLSYFFTISTLITTPAP